MKVSTLIVCYFHLYSTLVAIAFGAMTRVSIIARVSIYSPFRYSLL